MSLMDWSQYIGEKTSEVVPYSYVFYVAQTTRIQFTQVPFLVSAIRYTVSTEDVHFYFLINNREYGHWDLFSPSGLIPVRPNLLLTGKDVFLHVGNVEKPLRIALDGERIRTL